MDWLDKFQSKFGQWYQGAFGVSQETEMTPRDVLNKIMDAMDEARIEGIDGKIYVPNKYILELAVMNSDERSYLLSLLDEEELGTVLERYMAHKNYLTRGPLDFTIEELEAFPGEEKIYVRALFERAPKSSPAAAPAPSMAAREQSPDTDSRTRISDPTDDELTVPAAMSMSEDDLPTVHASPTAWAALQVEHLDGTRSLVSITKPIFTIGRSRHAGNDLVLSDDGQVSKRHLRIELEPDGGATAYDLASTNGTCVNDKLVPVNAALTHGDLLEIGQTKMVFQRVADPAAGIGRPRSIQTDQTVPPADASVLQPPVLPPSRKTARLQRVDYTAEYLLGSEALVGRGATCDIVLSDPTVSTQQARITSDFAGYHLQDLSGRGTTIVNGRPTRTGERYLMKVGDRINLGGIAFIFEIA